jgi:hypothetical protein
MIAITTSSSIRVNPDRWFERATAYLLATTTG